MCWNSVCFLCPLLVPSPRGLLTRACTHTQAPLHTCTPGLRPRARAPGWAVGQPASLLTLSPAPREVCRPLRRGGRPSWAGAIMWLACPPMARGRCEVSAAVRLRWDETVAGKAGRVWMAWLRAGVPRSEPLEGAAARQKRGASVSAGGAAGSGAGGAAGGSRRPSPSSSSAPTFLPTPLPGVEIHGPLGFCHSAALGLGEDGSTLLCLSFHTCKTATGTPRPLCGPTPGLNPSDSITSSEIITVTTIR